MAMETRNQSMNPDSAMNPGSAVEDASNRLGATTGRLSARAHEAVDQVASAVHGAADRLGTRGEQWMSSGDEMMAQMRNYVREKPITSLAIAAAIGFVLSKLTR